MHAMQALSKGKPQKLSDYMGKFMKKEISQNFLDEGREDMVNNLKDFLDCLQ